ncbi:MAG: lysine--tRNA ligase [Candidatus Binatus sp.]|uniref:lysine--tRNA ligase n=1 Tax=Candidatus Binatus sp. TaxID=2811406 RepID=UPI002720236C|nr:lysine--tRNA ligase [Candidatus Binatus sp.]MDO8434369.1 lysine--tRNA ligase [Candidatus Binatus sp.]
MAGAGKNESQAPAVSGATLWPREEAERLRERVSSYEASRPVIFQSGFGPSGLPHLGTMCEILRPSYVRHAFGKIEPSRPTRLIVFIDDMDGLRKVPENVPRREEIAQHLGQPVSKISDPFGCCASFSEHMVGLLTKFLEPVEVEYELIRSSEMYSAGRFDEALKLILEKHQAITAIITPTLREENRAGWSPFMPLCPRCGQVIERRVTAYHVERAAIEFVCEKSAGGVAGCGFSGEQSVLGGKAKVQWKVDWALRWYALAVDYELYGKDLTDSARLSGQILRVLGGNPPLGFPFEMFLDEEGRKVSKSIGRGVTVEQWTRYAPIEVLKMFLLQNPRRARKLFLGSIPQYVDEFLGALREHANADEAAQKSSALEFVLQKNTPRRFNSDLSFGMMMNLVATLGSSDRDFIWKYLTSYDTAIAGDAETEAMARTLIECTLNFYADFIEPTKQAYAPTGVEREQLQSLVEFLGEHRDASAEEIEKKIYDLGRENYDKPGKIFPLMYRSILGQERGPRLGAFIRLATPARVLELLDATLARSA